MTETINQIMIDLETLSTRQNAIITELGWAVFTKDGIVKSGQYLIDVEDQSRLGGDISGDAMRFWMKENYEQLSGFFDKKEKTTMGNALISLAGVIVTFNIKHVWANSPSFDLAILKHWYGRFNQQLPWIFKNERDFRTINQELIDKGIVVKSEFDWGGKHHAEQDAVNQARLICDFLKFQDSFLHMEIKTNSGNKPSLEL